MTETFNLRTAMGWLQDGLVQDLTQGRALLPHPDEVGGNLELHWAEMLRGFLPKRYTVGKGFVIDVKGDRSDQMDVVIFDQQYSPQIFVRDGTNYVPAESVYAVFEAKQDLSKEQISYAAGKIASVRRLERTSANIPTADGVWDPRPLPRILGGILTLSSSWSPPFGESFVSALPGWANDQSRLDLGCAAGSGAFEVPGDEAGLNVWPAREDALVWFVTRLLARLQAMATVPAIDIARWADVALGKNSAGAAE